MRAADNGKRVMALFEYEDDLIRAIEKLRAENFRVITVFTPFKDQDLQIALGKGPSITRLFTLVGGVAGGLWIVWLAIYAHTSFHLMTWGKPVLPWVSWVLVTYVIVILFAAFFNFFAWIFSSGLPQSRLPAGYDESLTGDRMGLVIGLAEDRQDRLIELLSGSGATEIKAIPADESRRKPVLGATIEAARG